VIFVGGIPALAFLLFVFAGIFVPLVYHAYRQPDTVGRRWFLLITVFQCFWLVTYGLQLLSTSSPRVYTLHTISSAASIAAVIAGLYFWLTIAGQLSVVRPSTIIPGFLLPVVFVGSHVIDPALVHREYEQVQRYGATVIESEPTILMTTIEFLVLVTVFVSVFALASAIYHHRERYRTHAPWIGLFFVVSLGSYIIYRSGLVAIPPGPFIAPVQAIIYGHLLFRYELPEIDFRTRRIGLSKAVDTLDDGLVIVDEDWAVVEANTTIEQVFETPEQLLETPLSEILGADTVQRLRHGESVTLAPGPGTELEGTADPITSEQGERLGQVVLLKDVTELKAREERLSVLNRVMRHNVHNQMTLVTANAQLLEHDLDGEHAIKAAEIHEAAESIVELGQKARSVQDIIDRTASCTRVDVSQLSRTVVDDLAESYPAVEFVVRGQETIIQTQPNVLSTMVHTVVENGAEYNDAVSPTVEISVERTDRAVVVSVSDNGPGIPQMECDALGSTETQLDHGNGLGLWLVQWGADKLGGDVDFSISDGTTVTMTIPDRTSESTVSEPVSA
jgi:signal transduction histidine kinase